jgi:hypothetical protein
MLYSPDAWSSFFLAITSAGAALCGLIFVALSLNLQRIIKLRALVGRAGEAVAILLATVIFSLVCLAPQLTDTILGLLVIAGGIFLWIFITTLNRSAYREQKGTLPMHLFVTRFMLTQIAILPIIISGISLMLGVGGGLAWLAFGLSFSLIVGVFDAWVLTIEILR